MGCPVASTRYAGESCSKLAGGRESPRLMKHGGYPLWLPAAALVEHQGARAAGGVSAPCCAFAPASKAISPAEPLPLQRSGQATPFLPLLNPLIGSSGCWLEGPVNFRGSELTAAVRSPGPVEPVGVHAIGRACQFPGRVAGWFALDARVELALNNAFRDRSVKRALRAARATSQVQALPEG